MDLIFFGMQGSGKGTLGPAVAEKFGLKIFETGKELRSLATQDSPLAKKVKAIMDAGQLVSNEVVMEIVENFLDNLEPGTDVLFDGIPRKVVQAESLNALLDKHGRNYKAVLLKIGEDTAYKRLAIRQRSDDAPEIIEKRIALYREETLPALETYKDNLVEIDGEPPIEQVRELAFEKLNPLFN